MSQKLKENFKHGGGQARNALRRGRKEREIDSQESVEPRRGEGGPRNDTMKRTRRKGRLLHNT